MNGYESGIRAIDSSIRPKMVRYRALEEGKAAVLCIIRRRMVRCVHCTYSSHTFRLARGVSEELASCISGHRNDHLAKVARCRTSCSKCVKSSWRAAALDFLIGFLMTAKLRCAVWYVTGPPCSLEQAKTLDYKIFI